MGSCFSQEQGPPYKSVGLTDGQIKKADTGGNITKGTKVEGFPDATSSNKVEIQQQATENEIHRPSKKTKQKEQNLMNKITPFEDDVFIRLLNKQLKVLSPTYEQLIEIFGYLQTLNFSYSQKLKEEQIELITDLLRTNPKSNMNQLIKKLGEKRTMKNLERIKSRLLYSLSNTLIQQKFKDFKLKILEVEEINELVRYQGIQLEVEQFTESFYLKFLQMKKNTQQMGLLFRQCLYRNKDILSDKGFFILQNGFRAARFARHGCTSDKRGIYIFLNYLAITIKNLEEKNVSLDLIEELIKLLIENLSKMYPPGQDLVGGDDSLKQTLKEIEVVWDKQSGPLQNNPLISFKDEDNKRKVLQHSILERARIAGEELPYLNEIIRENCLKKCIGVDSNLKLYAQAKNEKALIRITEKILFKEQKKAEENQQSPSKGINDQQIEVLEKKYQQEIKEMLNGQGKVSQNSDRLSDRLKKQQEKYQLEVQNRLKGKESLEFGISDMVRGKCTFSKIQDIIETIESIKQYVQQKRKIDPKRFRILEVESRFTKPIPISDITLKIALHERIIAELQLTLQNNVATYAFAHKIYEFQRSKAFSKIKTIFNYYEEYKNQFQELVIGQLQLSKLQTSKQSQIVQTLAKDVVTYFEISGNNEPVSLINVMNERQYKSIVLNEEQKMIVEAVFDRKMMKTKEERANLFLKPLKKNPNPFNSVLFYQMIKDIDISNNADEICGSYKSVQEYLNKEFKLNNAQQYSLRATYLKTLRTQIKLRQLKVLFNLIKKGPTDISYEPLLKRVYGNNHELCEWLIKKGKVFDYIFQYKKANEQYGKALEISNEKGEEQLILKIQFSKAIMLIKNGSFKQAAQILSKAEPKYKEAKQYRNVTICTILLSECALSLGDNENFRNLYSTAHEIVKLHKINFTGVEIADSEYRIGQRLLKQSPNDALDVHARYAFEQYGGFLSAQQLLRKMKESWGNYQKIGIEQPKLKVNGAIKQLILESSQIDADGCLHMSKAQWPNLLKINLKHNNIDAEGCSHLSKVSWPNLQKINFQINKIDADGCLHLTKAQWPNLQKIELQKNKIDDEGCLNLTKSHWQNLKILTLAQNNIGLDGCLHLTKAQWPNLQRIYLSDNKIGVEGSLHLSKGQWPHLKEISISRNQIPQGSLQEIKQLFKTAFPKTLSHLL